MPAITDPAYWKDRYIFPQLIEGIVKGLGPRFTPALRKDIEALGFNLDKLPPAIPGREMQRLVPAFANGAFPEEPPDERLRLLGLWTIRGWQKGLLGAAATQMLRLIGPRRTLLRLDRAFSTVDNYSKSTTEFVGETEALVRVHDPNGFPTYWVGIMQAGVEMLGLQGTVTLEPEPGAHEVVMRVKWT